jgi:hypothetical protein
MRGLEDTQLEVTMRNARFGLMAGLAGATLCFFAATGYSQNTNTPATAGGSVSSQNDAGTAQGTQPSTPTGSATTQAPADAGAGNTSVTTRSTETGVTTSTETTSFPGGFWGIIAVVVLVVLVLGALFRGRDRTVVRESYTSSSASAPTGRTAGTATDDRLNVSSRAASGTGTTSGGMNDPNARS